MKIAIASNDLKRVTGHLGRCKSFVIYKTENGKIIDREVRENTFRHHHHGHTELVHNLNDCEVVIFQSGGWRIIEDLKAANIKPFLTDERIADVAAEKYLNNELTEREENACAHH